MCKSLNSKYKEQNEIHTYIHYFYMYSSISLENQKIYIAEMLTGDTVNKITPIDIYTS